MIRRPPRSTLFPTRRSSDLAFHYAHRPHFDGADARARKAAGDFNGFFNVRSEEHTSELQSRLHLVCRLLLEKKKTNNMIIISAYLRIDDVISTYGRLYVDYR